jgi:hypothetical protein
MAACITRRISDGVSVNSIGFLGSFPIGVIIVLNIFGEPVSDIVFG